jgi:hypothetical protein
VKWTSVVLARISKEPSAFSAAIRFFASSLFFFPRGEGKGGLSPFQGGGEAQTGRLMRH